MGARSLADVHNALAAAELSQGHAIAFAFFAERRVDAVDPSPPLPAPPDPLRVHRTIGEQRGRHMYRAGRPHCPPLPQQRPIGRAQWWAWVCQYVYISVVALSVKQKY